MSTKTQSCQELIILINVGTSLLSGLKEKEDVTFYAALHRRVLPPCIRNDFLYIKLKLKWRNLEDTF